MNGFLYVAARQRARLCEKLTDGRVPACAGASLRVRGLDDADRDALADTQYAGNPTRWSAGPVQILGTVHKHTLRVQNHAKA